MALFGQHGHLFPWAPVFFALGIGAYFLLRQEPGWAALLGCGGLCLIGGLLCWRWPSGLNPLIWAVVLVAAGFGAAMMRAHLVAEPVLGFRYYGTVEGRIIGMDRSASDKLRLTLDQVWIEDTRPARIPGRVRVSLHGPDPPVLLPGQRIRTLAHLSPPQGPVEPGGFDFQRHAWFKRLGAVGYSRKAVSILAPPDGARPVFALRMAISARVQAVLEGDVGGFAAAVTTGDRSGVSKQVLSDLRASNLAHLLAISGLHMGLLAGFVFAAIRASLVMIPGAGLRWPVKQLAAFGALLAGAGYLALSGGNVATERAYIMVAMALGAVMLDRRALTLRAVALAALVVLILRPEALMGPGFQMSFAATTALVAIFGGLRATPFARLPRWLGTAAGVFLSSAIAGLATAPFGAAHFNTLSQYGLIANLLSVPLMGILVVPAAVVAALLAPFGLEALGLIPMGWGLSWILMVADWVAGFEGAQRPVITPTGRVLPLLSLGALFVILWQGRVRWMGMIPVCVAFVLWAQSERPALLVADNGGLVGVMTEQGRALSRKRGTGFVARVWLENDGVLRAQENAAKLWPRTEGAIQVTQLGDLKVLHVHGKRAAQEVTRCFPGEIVIASTSLNLQGGCDMYNPRRLRKTGSLAIKDGRLITARQLSGNRLWNAWWVRKRFGR